MASRFVPLIGLALPIVMVACSAEPVAPAARDDMPAGGTILTSFDRLMLARGGRTTFRAFLVAPGARLATAGLAFESRDPAIAKVSDGRGRAEVEGVAAGRTWIAVQTSGASDSVEVVVE